MKINAKFFNDNSDAIQQIQSQQLHVWQLK